MQRSFASAALTKVAGPAAMCCTQRWMGVWAKPANNEYLAKLPRARDLRREILSAAASHYAPGSTVFDEGEDLKPDPSLEEWALDVYDMTPEDFNQKGLATTHHLSDERMLEDLDDCDPDAQINAQLRDAEEFSAQTLRS